MITGERISGCSRILDSLLRELCSRRFSVVFDVFKVNKRFWISSSSADGLMVTSGCSKMRSSLCEAVNCRIALEGAMLLDSREHIYRLSIQWRQPFLTSIGESISALCRSIDEADDSSWISVYDVHLYLVRMLTSALCLLSFLVFVQWI